MYQIKNKRIMVRFSEKEYNYLKKGADEHDMQLSEYIRWRLKPVRVLKGATSKIDIITNL